MRDVADRLHTLEDRLDRILTSGWRQAGSEADELAAEANALADLGLVELAARVRAVPDARTASEALGAITLAVAASRLVRSRIDQGGAPPERSLPVTFGKRRRAAEADLLTPLCRFAHAGGEAWSCLRLRGFAVEWVLVEATEAEVAPLHYLRGHLRWQARFPLGVGRELQLHRLVDAAPVGPEEKAYDPHNSFRKLLLSAKPRDDKLPLWGGGYLHLLPLNWDELVEASWFNPAVAADLKAASDDETWALVADDSGVRAVAAVFRLDGLLRHHLDVVHLLPGCPGERLS